MMNLPNPSQPNPLAAVALLHDDRRFSPTDRQRQLYEALLSAPCPAPHANPRADRLTLPGDNILVARHHLSDWPGS